MRLRDIVLTVLSLILMDMLLPNDKDIDEILNNLSINDYKDDLEMLALFEWFKDNNTRD